MMLTIWSTTARTPEHEPACSRSRPRANKPPALKSASLTCDMPPAPVQVPKSPHLGAGAEVAAPLLRQAVDHLAGRVAALRSALERARVEGHALVPRVHRPAIVGRELVAVGRADLAVIDRVLEFADR
eukprot:scaffold51868_cov66-Phaeocystis_antarctica.AAC.1